MNRVTIIGRLTKDVTLTYTAGNNTAVAKFTVAVNRKFAKEGEQKADFIQVVAFGKTAENCGKYIGKGRLVSVAGRIQTGHYDDTDGKRHYTFDVIAEEVEFLDKVENKSNEGSGFSPASDEDEGDLPF